MTNRTNSPRLAQPVQSLVLLVAALSVGILGCSQTRRQEPQAQQGSDPRRW